MCLFGSFTVQYPRDSFLGQSNLRTAHCSATKGMWTQCFLCHYLVQWFVMTLQDIVRHQHFCYWTICAWKQAEQFFVYLPPNNCLLCLLKRLLTLSSLHPRKYSYWWFFCLFALMRAAESWQESQRRFWVCFGLSRRQDAVLIWSAAIAPLLIKPTWTLWEEVTSCGKLLILTGRSKTHIPADRMEE